MAKQMVVQEVERIEELSAIELRDRQAKPDGMPQHPFRNRAWICNLLDIDWPVVYFEYGQFAVAGRGKVTEAKIAKLLEAEKLPATEENRATARLVIQEERYAMTLITARISSRDIGNKERSDIDVGALHIAHDIVRMCNENSGVGDPDNGILPFAGIFVCESEQPGEAQLEEEEGKLRKYFEFLVPMAEGEYQRNRRMDWIPGIAMRAAKWLKADTTFMLKKENMVPCLYCRTNVSALAAICPNCHNVINPERERELRAIGARAAGGDSEEVTQEVATPQETPQKPSHKRK